MYIGWHGFAIDRSCCGNSFVRGVRYHPGRLNALREASDIDMVQEPSENTEQQPAAGASHQAAQARAGLGRAVHKNPNDPAAWYGLALTFAQGERRQYCLERALQLDPQHAGARRELAALRAAASGAPAHTSEPPAQHAPPVTADATMPQPQPEAAPMASGNTDPATGVLPPLAARLAARQAGVANEQSETTPEQERPRPAHERLAPPRVRRIAEPPPPLRTVTLTRATDGAPERVSDEEIARAALQQLLRTGAAIDTNDARASSAANIARRYFGTTRPVVHPAQANQDDALRALGLQRRPEQRTRVTVLLGVLTLVTLLVALLFTTLVG
jgi:hypothetical protein